MFNLFISLYLFILSIYLLIAMFMLFYIAKRINKEDIKQNIKRIRKHEKVTSISFNSPLNPYERYKDKATNLYEPRKQGGGVRIEVEKN